MSKNWLVCSAVMWLLDEKSRYLELQRGKNNLHLSFTVFWQYFPSDCEFFYIKFQKPMCSYLRETLNFWKSKMSSAAIFEIEKNRDISSTVCPITINLACWCRTALINPSVVRNFETLKLKMVDVSHSDANRLAIVKVSNNWKFKMAAGRHFQNH